jgi:hypothetical protein
MGSRSEPPYVAHSAASARLGPFSTVHRVASPLRMVAPGIAAIASLVAALLLLDVNTLVMLLLCLAMIVASVYLVVGLAWSNRDVYLYRDGLVHVDRESVTAIRFDQVQILERIGRRFLGTTSYRVTGGGYYVRISGMVNESRALGQRLEHEVRQRGGRVV